MAIDIEKRVRLIDVAKQAGVSRVTVAKVLHNTGGNTRVSNETAELIRDIAKKMGYRPNLSARSLKTNRTHLIGLIGGGIWESNRGRLITLLSKELSAYKASLQIHGVGNEDREAAVWAAYTRPVDGLIVLPDQPLKPGTLLSKLIESNFPVLFLLCKPRLDCDFVTVDRFKAVEKSIYHLKKLGHKRIGFAVFHESEKRYQAYRCITRKLGLDINEKWCHDLYGTYECGYKLGKKVKAGSGNPTAYVLHNDISAIGFIRGLSERGIQVPDNISVIGFGNEEMSQYTRPSISSINIPMEDICSKAVKYIVERAYGINGKKKPVDVRLELEPDIVVRESCAGPEK